MENAGTTRIVIPYSPRNWASSSLHNRKDRFICLVVHRQAGKTVATINHLIRDSIKNPGKMFAHISPTFTMAKRNAWGHLKTYSRVIPGMKFNEQELSAEFPNNSKIYLLGADNPDSLRGMTLSGIVLDEFALHKEDLFGIILPILAVEHGYCIVCGTPKGRNNHLYTFFTKDNWFKAKLDWTETQSLDTVEINEQKSEMSLSEFKQEYECEFLEGSDNSYFDKYDQVCILDHGSEPNRESLYTLGVDLGWKVDYTVLTVFERGTNRMVYWERVQYDWVTTKRIISDIAHKYNNAAVLIDSTATQNVFLDELQSLGLNAEGFPFNHKSKAELMKKLQSYISQKYISVMKIPVLMEELKEFQYPDLAAPVGLHDDAVCSLALAIWNLTPPQIITNEVPDIIWLASNQQQ